MMKLRNKLLNAEYLIMRVAARRYDCAVNDILSPSRVAPLIWPRQISMWAAARLTDHNSVILAYRFNRNHATVRYTVSKIDQQYCSDPCHRKELNDFLRDILSQPEVLRESCNLELYDLHRPLSEDSRWLGAANVHADS